MRNPSHTALRTELRRDFAWLLERFPLDKYPPYVRGTSPEVLQWFRPFADWILGRVRSFRQPECPVVLLTACSYAKPYSHSHIHYTIRKALFRGNMLDQVEYWHLSSAGVIPSLLEEEAPFCSYDWNNKDATTLELACLRKALQDYYARWLGLYVQPERLRVVTFFREDSNTAWAVNSVPEPSFLVHHVRVPPGVMEDSLVSDPDCALIGDDALRDLCTVISMRLSEAEQEKDG